MNCSNVAKPKSKSLFGALAVTVLVIFGSQTSAMLGYVLALSALIMIIVAMYMESIWPTRAKEENPLVFSLFWGLIIGVIVPYLVTTFLEGGASAVFEIFTTQP
jgi:Mg/Co/Ni transporter MgtE